jgi:hypothetical protein
VLWQARTAKPSSRHAPTLLPVARPSRSVSAAPPSILREIPPTPPFGCDPYFDDLYFGDFLTALDTMELEQLDDIIYSYFCDGRRPAPPAVVKAILGPGSLLQEEMLLAPFLEVDEPLRLSEAARWLEPYRNQLGAVKIERWCQFRAVFQGQRRLHTIRLRVDSESRTAFKELKAVRRGEHGRHPHCMSLACSWCSL